MPEGMPRIAEESAEQEASDVIERAKTGEVNKGETLGRVNFEMAPILRDLLVLTERRSVAEGPELLEIDAKEKDLLAQLEPLLERVKKFTAR